MENVDICNIALTTLGDYSITAAELTAGSPELARKFKEIYDDMRDDMVYSHPWNFATKRVYLSRTGAFTGRGLDDCTADCDSYTQSTPLSYRVQIDGAGAPDTFKWSDDGGSTWDATLVAITGAAQTLNNGVTITFTATTGHTVDNYWDISATWIPAYEYDYKFKLPTDYLRKVKTDLYKSEFKIEGGYLVTSEAAVELEYIAQITDPTEFSNGFIMAFAARLSAELCYSITNSATLTKGKWEEYKLKLSKGKSLDGQESAPDIKTRSNWIEGRG